MLTTIINLIMKSAGKKKKKVLHAVDLWVLWFRNFDVENLSSTSSNFFSHL